MRVFSFLPLVALLASQLCSEANSSGLQLGSDILYNIEWLGGSIEELQLEQAQSSESVKVLPGELLSEGQWSEEAVDIRTSHNEQYTCLLPGQEPPALANGVEETGELVGPEYLLKPIKHQCTRLLMGYWNYELCHWDYLRQYHEDKQQDDQVSIDEYILGQYNKELEAPPTEQEADSTPSKEKVPVIPIQGREYGYYPVAMAMGTPCDLKNNEPRSVVVKYICDQEAYKYGTLLRVDEVTTCQYEALVSTPQLCQNVHYRLKEQPVQNIKCYPKNGSPRKPQAVLEEEILSSNLKSSQSHMSESQSSEAQSNEKPYRKELQSKDVQLDENFIKAFLSGETCLRGGTGWWHHELCHEQYVKQLHFDQSGEKTEVALGYWSEEDHAAWYKRTGYKKQSKLQVVHLYKSGDVCEVTGSPRQCLVKYKCATSSKGSAIVLYLEEPTTCSYSLTVEGAFVCSILENTDQHGVFISGPEDDENQQSSSDGIIESTKKQATSDTNMESIEKPSTSDTRIESTKKQGGNDASIDSTENPVSSGDKVETQQLPTDGTKSKDSEHRKQLSSINQQNNQANSDNSVKSVEKQLPSDGASSNLNYKTEKVSSADQQSRQASDINIESTEPQTTGGKSVRSRETSKPVPSDGELNELDNKKAYSSDQQENQDGNARLSDIVESNGKEYNSEQNPAPEKKSNSAQHKLDSSEKSGQNPSSSNDHSETENKQPSRS